MIQWISQINLHRSDDRILSLYYKYFIFEALNPQQWENNIKFSTLPLFVMANSHSSTFVCLQCWNVSLDVFSSALCSLNTKNIGINILASLKVPYLSANMSHLFLYTGHHIALEINLYDKLALIQVKINLARNAFHALVHVDK